MRKVFQKAGKWGVVAAVIAVSVTAPIAIHSFFDLPPGAILPIQFHSPVSIPVGTGITCSVTGVTFTGDGFTVAADCPVPIQIDQAESTPTDLLATEPTEAPVTPDPYLPPLIDPTVYP